MELLTALGPSDLDHFDRNVGSPKPEDEPLHLGAERHAWAKLTERELLADVRLDPRRRGGRQSDHGRVLP